VQTGVILAQGLWETVRLVYRILYVLTARLGII